MSALKSQIESLLFISSKPIALEQLVGLLKVEKKEIEEACKILIAENKNAERGVHVIKNGSKYQMVSAPENAGLISAFINDETSGELSRPSLETLTIIAYRAPILKTDLDRIRGVNCSLILRNLLLRGLIEAKSQGAQEELSYSPTLDLLRFLGVDRVEDLPDYERLHRAENIENFLKTDESKEDGLEINN